MALAVATTRLARISAFVPVFLILAGAAGLSGCVQSTASSKPSAQPMLAVAPPATGAPVVLSGVAYTEADIAANPAPVGPSKADIVTPTGSTTQAVSATPLPGSAPIVMSAPSAIRPSAPPAPVVAAAPPPPPPVPPAPMMTTAPTPVISAPTPVGVMPTITTMGQIPTQVVDEKGFPNINVPPREPSGQLLSAEERAKLIAELNALAGRPTQ